MTIRLEQPKDYREVENLTREAFWNVYHPGCTEHYVLNQYRTNPDFIPGLDLVMIEDDIYRHAGFDLASKLKIHYHAEPRESEAPYFLAQELIPGYWGHRAGTYCPPRGYFVADEHPEAFEAYEATFPEKEKLRLPGQLGYEE